jgi:transposase InsO family protein
VTLWRYIIALSLLGTVTIGVWLRWSLAGAWEVRTMLFDYIEVFYNRERAHSSLGFLSPVDFENALSTT